MAASYTVLGSYATVQVVSTTSVIDVLRITCRTIPSGVVFSANAPYRNIAAVPITQAHVTPDQVAQIAKVFLAPLAVGIERMMGSGEVSGAISEQDIDASGLLIDYISATVSYSPNTPAQPLAFTQTVRIPTNAFDEPSFYDPLIGSVINDAYVALQKLAAA